MVSQSKRANWRESIIEARIAGYDLDGNGTIDKAEAKIMIRDLLDAEMESKQRFRWIVVLACVVMILTICNIGATFVSVHLAKDTKLSDANELVAENSNEPVRVTGKGFNLPVDMTAPGDDGYRHVCLNMGDVAQLWHSAESGTKTSLSGNVEDGTMYGAELSFDGAYQNDTHIAMRTTRNELFWVDLQDERCMEDNRRLKYSGKDDSGPTAKKAFQAELNSLRRLGDRHGHVRASTEELHRELATVARWGGVSRKKFKKDIQYLEDSDRRALAAELLGFNLATYKYKASRGGDGRTHLGFIMEDVEPSFAAHSEEDKVDLYGFTSMAVATLQTQQETIDKLSKEVSDLKELLSNGSLENQK